MSVRNETQDETFFPPGKTTGAKAGYKRTRSSTGGNQVAERPLEPHPYTATHLDAYYPLLAIRNCKNGAVSEYTAGTFFGPTFPQGDWNANDDASLYGRLEEEYDNGDFNAGIFAGELGETVDLLAGRVKQLALAARAARKGNFADALQHLKKSGVRVPKNPKRPPKNGMGVQDPSRASSLWLELQYGWKPLVSDIYSLSETIVNLDQPRKRRIVARGRKPALVTPNLASAFNYTGNSWVQKQIVAYITEDIPSWPAALGLMDPELVAWELVPFSFVVDWFLPIGNWLQARAFAQRAKGTFVVTTTRRYHCRYADVKPYAWACIKWPNSQYYSQESLGWYRYITVVRTVGQSLPQVPMPVFTNGIGKGNRLANALALGVSIFGKPR